MAVNFDSTTTRLLTLLNVSATKANKRKRPEESQPTVKLNKRRTIQFDSSSPEHDAGPSSTGQVQVQESAESVPENVGDDVEAAEEGDGTGTPFAAQTVDPIIAILQTLRKIHMKLILVRSRQC